MHQHIVHVIPVVQHIAFHLPIYIHHALHALPGMRNMAGGPELLRR